MSCLMCSLCEKQIPEPAEGALGVGYAVHPTGEKICYSCCAKVDVKDMVEQGSISLYLAGKEITNWPGTLRFSVLHSKKGGHNFSGTRTDAWFNGPDGHVWHAIQIGNNNQVARCKRTKEKTYGTRTTSI
jgi:hypothetical protein